MWIERAIKTEIQRSIDKFSSILITGARQTGKTSLLKNIFPNYSYYSFEDANTADYADNSPKDFLNSLHYPVIFDEVQYVGKIFRYIKLYIDQNPGKTLFYLTGSQNFSMMQNVSESLSGRIRIFNLSSLSYDEIAEFDPQVTIFDYLIKGGYPALYSKNLNPIEWFPSYLSTYLERDVRNILNISNLRDFDRFLRLLGVRSGQVLNMSDLAKDIGISTNTVKSWVSVLETSGMIYLLEPYYQNYGKRIIKSPKIYFLDLGLLSYLNNFTSIDIINKSPYSGAIWETYVFNQIIRKFFIKGIIRPPIWFLRFVNGIEVDFVVERYGKLDLIEAKYKEVITDRDTKGINYTKEIMGESSIGNRYVIYKNRNRSVTKDGIILLNNPD